MKNAKTKKFISDILTALIIVDCVFMVGFPIVWMVLSSFKPGVELFTIPPRIFPKNWSLEWYRQALANENVIRYFLNSVFIATTVMAIDMAVGIANYISSTHIDWGIIMSLGTITTLPVIVLFALVQKYFVEGMTAGAVKG